MKIEGEIRSKYLKEKIRESGGIMNIAIRYVCVGWWQIFKHPSGLMSAVEDVENHVEVKIDDLTIFIHQEVFKNIDRKKNELFFRVQDLGSYTLFLKIPVELEVELIK